MLEKFKHKILGLKKAAGVEAIYTADGKTIYNLIILSRNKDLISIEAKECNIEDIEKLKSLLPSETPISLIVNGRGILHKKALDPTATDNNNLISQILPNAKESDFYLQKFYSGKNLFLSVIRRDGLNKIGELFKKNQLPIVYAASGPFPAENVIPFLKLTDDHISFSGFNISVKNNLIGDFSLVQEKNETIFELGEEKIPAALLTAYAGAFNLFLENSHQGLEADFVQFEADEFKNKALFKIFGYGALGFFLVLMLLNYFCFNYFKTENNELSGKSNAYEGMVKDIERLEKQVEEKEYFLKGAGWLSLPRTSYFADQIASTIPSSIKLKEIKINPLNDKLSKKQKKQIFQGDTIFIAGACNDPVVLNPWMKELKDLKWILKANNVNYIHDNKTGSGNFEVEITVSNEF